MSRPLTSLWPRAQKPWSNKGMNLDANALDSLQLAFSPGSLWLLNIVLALVMFGVALDLRREDFKRVARAPKSPIVGLFAQFLVLPALTWALTMIIRPQPSIAMGMILVAACPGGNVSNFVSHLAKGNTALSVSLTAVSTLGAMLMTPINVGLWGGLNPDTAELLRSFSLNPGSMLITVVTILGLPLVLGMLVAEKAPTWAARLKGPMKIFGIIALFGFIVGALQKNWGAFVAHIDKVILIVALHNLLALCTGWSMGRLFGLPARDRRTLTIEVGIQNSGLGLVLIFGFFGGLGGMAVIAATWGIWHIVAGLTIAFFWAKRPLPDAEDRVAPPSS